MKLIMPSMKVEDTMTSSLVLHATEAGNGRQTRQANQRYKDPSIRLEERELKPLAPDGLRLQMLRVGICGTDIHMTQKDPNGYVRCSAPASIPEHGRILGHEGIGRVIATGADVSSFRVGEIVAPESVLSCGLCRPCRAGAFNQCRHARLLGMENDGLFSAIADVPARSAVGIHRLAESEQGLQMAACLEPAGVALLTGLKAQMSPGDKVLIFGAGPIGLLCAMMARRLHGASAVCMVEPSAYRRDFAAAWTDQVVESVEALETPDGGWDVVVEASGILANVNTVFRQIAPCGRVALLGRGGEALLVEAVDHMITNAISVMGLRGHLGGVYERLIDLCVSGVLPLDRIVSTTMEGLDKLCHVLERPDSISSADCKIVVKLSS
ncbi:zinc-binding dehydrogenase [Cyanobium sp. Morenito 9A2]|uniref:zinc-dependent alcohol dehydrogenase n=1 Tax=Cyanobium sp. Morenito 9A2 TaxID=2823718 RepID=UPI0020CCA51E|nr:zinc-binding dehydrogenase [Cyanobium sp. Morenito 9A2]MCP9849816.1 zinc-binding dehydrogenase [Cyanobium sp. Morenito 9A2]